MIVFYTLEKLVDLRTDVVIFRFTLVKIESLFNWHGQ